MYFTILYNDNPCQHLTSTYTASRRRSLCQGLGNWTGSVGRHKTQPWTRSIVHAMLQILGSALFPRPRIMAVLRRIVALKSMELGWDFEIWMCQTTSAIGKTW